MHIAAIGPQTSRFTVSGGPRQTGLRSARSLTSDLRGHCTTSVHRRAMRRPRPRQHRECRMRPDVGCVREGGGHSSGPAHRPRTGPWAMRGKREGRTVSRGHCIAMCDRIIRPGTLARSSADPLVVDAPVPCTGRWSARWLAVRVEGCTPCAALTAGSSEEGLQGCGAAEASGEQSQQQCHVGVHGSGSCRCRCRGERWVQRVGWGGYRSSGNIASMRVLTSAVLIGPVRGAVRSGFGTAGVEVLM